MLPMMTPMIRRTTNVTMMAFAQNQREEVRELGDAVSSLQAERGTHQQTFLMQKVCLEEIPRVSIQTGHTKGNGSGVNEDDISYTLEAVNGGGQAVIDIFRLDPESSNSMKSANPHSGCHREDICHTLDTTEPNPAKGQGGMAIVEKVNDHMALGWNHRDRNAKPVIGSTDPLAATDYKDPPLCGYEEETKEAIGLSDHTTPSAIVNGMPPLRACDWKCPAVCGYEGEDDGEGLFDDG